MPAATRKFFHSFPRRGRNETVEAQADKACAILEYMKEVGMVLAPELVTWEVPAAAGPQSLPMLQRRACLTELSDRELAPHAAQFGPITLVFDIERMRRLGAMPVIYAPQVLDPNDLSLLSVWTVNAVHHTDGVLGQLEDLRNASDPVRVQQTYGHPLALNAYLDLRNTNAAGSVVARYRIPATHVDAVMKHVGFNNIPFDHSRGAMQIFLSMFYPTDNEHVGEQLGYYRQREWRVISGGRLNFKGRPIGRELSDPEKARLLAIDNEFWSRTIRVDGQPKRRVDLAHIYDPVPEFRLLDGVERVVVAKHLMPRVRAILGDTVRVEKLRTPNWRSKILDAWAALVA